MSDQKVQQVIRPSQGGARSVDRKPEDENAVPSWGQSTTLGSEVKPSEVLKQPDGT